MGDQSSETNGDRSAPPAVHALHVADYDVVVRFGRMFRHLALALNAEGDRVSLLTDDVAVVADLEGTPITCHWFPHLSGWLAWRLPHLLTRHVPPGPQVVHLWGAACLRSVGRWALRSGLPVLVHALSARDIEYVVRRRLPPNLHVAVGSSGLLRLARKRSPALAEEFRVLPPAFLMPDLSDESENDVASHTLGVIWAGRVDESAGLETLVDAVAHLRHKGCDLQAALVGSGPAEGAIRERIRTARVQDCISLIDEPRLWDRVMRGVDVCVVPSRQHELGLAPLLAMAMGKVVVSSRDQLAEWFIEDQTVWQFTPGSAVELAYHLERVAEGHRRARELGDSAAAYVHQHHAIGRLVQDLRTAYRFAVDGRGAAVANATGPVRSEQP